jgi:hypothetical protein
MPMPSMSYWIRGQGLDAADIVSAASAGMELALAALGLMPPAPLF